MWTEKFERIKNDLYNKLMIHICKEIAMKVKNIIRILSTLVITIGMLFHTTGIRVNEYKVIHTCFESPFYNLYLDTTLIIK